MQPFKLTATGYNLNYLPEYIALRHGFFREQGLDLTVNIPVPWDGVLDALADGSADMCLGGIWVPTMYRDRVQHYTVFAQIANRCPLAILRRKTGDRSRSFKIEDVAGKTVLLKSGGGAAAGFFFKMLLRENGVDARAVDYVQDLDGKMLGDLFQGGMGDFFVTDYLSALTMTTKNAEVEIALEAVTQGEVPWSVYYAQTSKVSPELLDKQRRFCVALGKGIEWVMAHDAEETEFMKELEELFPDVPIEAAIKVTNRFRKEGMWTGTVIPHTAFDRWQKGLTDARLIKDPMVYQDLVDDGPAREAGNSPTAKLETLPMSCKPSAVGESGVNGVSVAVK